MALKFNCPKCSQEVVFKYLKAGETGKCPNCSTEIAVPADARATDQEPSIEKHSLTADVLTNNNTEKTTPVPAGKSVFVTVFAWIFIVISGMQTCISIPMNIMVNMMFPFDQMEKNMDDPKLQDFITPLHKFMFAHFRLLFFLMFILVAITFIASICLLKRKNWARKFFIGFMIFGLASNLVNLPFQFEMFSKMPVQGFAGPMAVITLIMVIGFSILYIWIIKKLMSEDIRKEFTELAGHPPSAENQ